jgi:two-component system phosphate regulon response regulator PhoB
VHHAQTQAHVTGVTLERHAPTTCPRYRNRLMAATLVIGGTDQARRLIGTHLPQEGFEPTFVDSGSDGLSLARRGGFAAVLLDWVLSDMPASEVCRQLKAHERTRNVPVVVVTAVDTEIDRIVAFELGAVDYVIEPFSVRELLLRLRVALDGKRGQSSKPPAARADTLLMLDFEARRALVRDHEIALSPREFELLAVLQSRPGVVLSRAQLCQSVWGEDGVSLRTVDASVKRLRRKLGPARHAVETVRGVGYRFREVEARTLPVKVA